MMVLKRDFTISCCLTLFENPTAESNWSEIPIRVSMNRSRMANNFHWQLQINLFIYSNWHWLAGFYYFPSFSCLSSLVLVLPFIIAIYLFFFLSFFLLLLSWSFFFFFFFFFFDSCSIHPSVLEPLVAFRCGGRGRDPGDVYAYWCKLASGVCDNGFRVPNAVRSLWETLKRSTISGCITWRKVDSVRSY